MKRFAFFLCFGLLLYPSPGHSENSTPFFEEILQTSHNMVPRGSVPPSSHQVCAICHTAEEVNAYIGASAPTPEELAPILDKTQNQPPKMEFKALWNPAMSEKSYPLNHAALKGDLSQRCLSCHDGVIGKDIHGKDGKSEKFLDHPVNITYPRETNGRFIPALPLPNELRYWSVPDQNESGVTLPTGPTSEYFKPQPFPLLLVRTSYGQVNCGSCHNPHTSTIPAYLRESPKTLCLVCHIR